MKLDQWLAHIERQHPSVIELGLDRVRIVKDALGQRQNTPLVLVGGTNGKGSTCALLESILRCAGYRTGLYTSPHLLSYNERVRIAGQPASDASLCASFDRVEQTRLACSEVPLTYFEFGTLAAWEAFALAGVEVVILEVGLGGRLDATNVYQPDVSVVTTVDLDHMDWLGPDREAIGYEKAGIFRSGKIAIVGDHDPPASLLTHAAAIGSDLRLIGRDFSVIDQQNQWCYRSWRSDRAGLPLPALRGAVQLINAACALAVLDALDGVLPVAQQEVRRGLLDVNWPGRCQRLPGRPEFILDVAHNPQAAQVLADNLAAMPPANTWAVFGMLRDKDIAGVIAALAGRIDHWLPISLPGERAASADELRFFLEASACQVVDLPASTAAAALRELRERAGGDDRIVAFGSFLTVAEILRLLGRTV